MREISKKNFSKNLKKETNIKMSNMNMKIKVNYIKSFKKTDKIQWIDKSKFEKYILPSFTKTIYKSIQDQI
jgi:A/G-specific adenine glycosylase